MDTKKVIKHRAERNHMRVVRHFFAMTVREPGKPPHMHVHRLIVDFDIRRADVLRVGAALDFDLLDASAFGGAATARRRRRSTVELHKLRIVHVSAESALYSF